MIENNSQYCNTLLQLTDTAVQRRWQRYLRKVYIGGNGSESQEARMPVNTSNGVIVYRTTYTVCAPASSTLAVTPPITSRLLYEGRGASFVIVSFYHFNIYNAYWKGVMFKHQDLLQSVWFPAQFWSMTITSICREGLARIPNKWLFLVWWYRSFLKIAGYPY